MKKLIVMGSLMLLAFLATPAMAVGAWTWVAGDPNYNPAATIHASTIGLPAPGDYIGTALNTYTNGFGSSGAAVGWDDTWTGGGNANTNGDNWDGLWVQPDIAAGQRGWWDLMDTYHRIVVSTSQDHGPYLAEGLEYHIRGCSQAFVDASCSANDATVTAVYLDGWRAFNPAEDSNVNGWCSDDISAVLDLGGDYQYIRLEGWAVGGALNEPEVDALGGIREFQTVPEFPTLAVPAALLVGIFLAAIWLRKKDA